MHNVLKHIKRFARNTNGSMSVEAIIMLPLLLWATAAMAVFFDLYRTKSNMDKASFTISDALSRETNAITPDYVTGAHSLLGELSGIDQDTSLRISVITWDEDDNRYDLEWSKFRGEFFAALTQADMTDLRERLPEMADQDTLILVESQFTYDPMFNVGPFGSEEDAQEGEDLGVQNLQTFVFTRPRYAPQLVFSAS